MKATVEIRDDLYAKLVEEAVRRYGSTKKISKLLNEILEEHFLARHAVSLFGCSPNLSPFKREEIDRLS
jgi:hypothetical protein